MELLTPIVTGVLLALFTAIQAWINKGRFDSLERLIRDTRTQLQTHEQSNERRFEQIGSEIAQLRSDLLQVVLALTPRQETG